MAVVNNLPEKKGYSQFPTFGVSTSGVNPNTDMNTDGIFCV